MSDANLCGDIRALVTVLREIRDEQKRGNEAAERTAAALERIAEGVNPRGDPSAVEMLTNIDWNIRRIANAGDP